MLHARWSVILLGCLAGAAGTAAACALSRHSSPPPLHVLLIDAAPATPPPAAAQISGAVVKPGVYPISPGERLADLVSAAGGLRPDADAGRLNLARRVGDGERFDVPSAAAGTPAADTPLRVRLNHASRDELLTLPGVTVSQASLIQSSVRKNGPVGSADELVRRRLASAAEAALLDPLVDWSP